MLSLQSLDFVLRYGLPLIQFPPREHHSCAQSLIPTPDPQSSFAELLSESTTLSQVILHSQGQSEGMGGPGGWWKKDRKLTSSFTRRLPACFCCEPQPVLGFSKAPGLPVAQSFPSSPLGPQWSGGMGLGFSDFCHVLVHRILGICGEGKWEVCRSSSRGYKATG